MGGPDTRRDTDLQRIEAALAEGAATAADPRERELQELALTLRADSPEPRAEFARSLDRRVDEGFAKQRTARFRRLWVPALAGAVALLVVAVVAISSLGGDSARETAVSAGLQTPKSSAPAPQAGTALPPATDLASRRVERDAQLTISTSKDKLQAAADGVGTIAQSHNGFVLSSEVNTGDESGAPGGSFVLRVPQTQLETTLADLAKLGNLRARSETGHDMTASFNSVQDRLGNALVERRTLRLRLKHAKGTKADDIRARIVALNAAVGTLSARMHDLRSRTVYSTVSVTLEQDRGGAGAGGSGGVGGAWHDATHTLEALLTFLIRALGVLLPLGLVAALTGFATRTLRRRRREAALS